MSAWILVPCLECLRDEFNTVSPSRDKGADGSIGDAAHQASVSDHNDDEVGNVPTRDEDTKHEVHAVDIDSTGPWPDGKGNEADGWFDRQVLRIAEQERVEYESATLVGRLQNIIWRGRIISRSWGWSEWRTYTGASQHFDHAHFSARYTSAQEADTRPWGVDDMPLTKTDGELVWKTDIIPNPKWRADAETNEATTAYFALGDVWNRVHSVELAVAAVAVQMKELTGRDFVDEAAIVAGVLAGLTPEAIAAAIPAELAEQVARELAERLAA